MSDRKPRPPAAAPFIGADRATAPMGVEQDSESAWQRFEDLQKAFDAGFDVTRPQTKPQPMASSSGYAATQPMDITRQKAPAPAPAVPAAITMEQVMVLARRNNRACPVPPQWAAFHQLLVSRTPPGSRTPAPVPVDGGAWAVTSPMQKRLRLRDQLEWADRAGVLPEVGAFLAGLTEQDWYHFGE
jgi:hypothetical protein